MQRIYFTVSEANQKIPQLERVFFRIYQIKGLSQTTFYRLEELGFAPEDENFKIHPAGAGLDVVDELANLKMLMMELRRQIEQLADEGCLVKDIALGLVDFHAEREGRDVFLCWKLGEKSITHWHELDGGFEARQPLSTKTSRKIKTTTPFAEPFVAVTGEKDIQNKEQAH